MPLYNPPVSSGVSQGDVDTAIAAAVAQVMPWRVVGNGLGTPAAKTNWDGSADEVDGNAMGLILSGSNGGGTQNALVVHDVVLGAGTWTLEVWWFGWNGHGIATVALDGGGGFVNVGSAPYNGSGSTMDGYSAGANNKLKKSITGIVIATAGKYRMRFKMETKNGSSSSYQGQFSHYVWTRTA